MKKTNVTNRKILMIFSIVISLLVTIGVSLAWYQAKISDRVIDDLNTAGIKIDLNTKNSNTLTPDILKEGVLNNTNKLPSDYSSKKANYIETAGNTITVKEDVKIVLSSYSDGSNSKTYTTATFTIGMKYLNSRGDVVDLTNYGEFFDVKYAMVTKGASYTLAAYNGAFTKKSSGDYDLHLSIAYKLPDELLPAELVNSSCITIYINSVLS